MSVTRSVFIYSGITKFFLKTDDARYSGAGIMMTSALAAWLSQQGFKLYAMGSDAPYKRDGILKDSYLLDGEQWIAAVRRAREMDHPPSILVPTGTTINVQDLVTCLHRHG